MINFLKKNINKDPRFAVLITEDGLYLKEFIKCVEKISETKLIKSPLSRLELGDIVFFDYPKNNSGNIVFIDRKKIGRKSVEKKLNGVVLISNEELTKITRLLKQYTELTLLTKEDDDFEVIARFLEYNQEMGDLTETLIRNIIDEVVTKKEEKRKYIYRGKQRINNDPVSIYEFWVKIGNKQFDIYVNDEGEEYIYYFGRKLYISDNRKYLYL